MLTLVRILRDSGIRPSIQVVEQTFTRSDFEWISSNQITNFKFSNIMIFIERSRIAFGCTEQPGHFSDLNVDTSLRSTI